MCVYVSVYCVCVRVCVFVCVYCVCICMCVCLCVCLCVHVFNVYTLHVYFVCVCIVCACECNLCVLCLYCVCILCLYSNSQQHEELGPTFDLGDGERFNFGVSTLNLNDNCNQWYAPGRAGGHQSNWRSSPPMEEKTRVTRHPPAITQRQSPPSSRPALAVSPKREEEGRIRRRVETTPPGTQAYGSHPPPLHIWEIPVFKQMASHPPPLHIWEINTTGWKIPQSP